MCTVILLARWEGAIFMLRSELVWPDGGKS